jgi:hypothetical protein
VARISGKLTYPPLAWFDNPKYTNEELRNLKNIEAPPYLERPYFSEYCEDLDDFKKELGLSDELCSRIEIWNNEFQATLADYPPDSCFSTLEAERQHWQKGLQIAQDLAEIFKGKYRVEYYVNGRGKIWVPPINDYQPNILRYLILTPNGGASPIQIDYINGFDEWFDLYGTYITPEALKLSEKLCHDLWLWNTSSNQDADWSCFFDRRKWKQKKYSEFISRIIGCHINKSKWKQKKYNEFGSQGEALLEKLRIELGDDYEIKRGNF